MTSLIKKVKGWLSSRKIQKEAIRQGKEMLRLADYFCGKNGHPAIEFGKKDSLTQTLGKIRLLNDCITNVLDRRAEELERKNRAKLAYLTVANKAVSLDGVTLN